MAQRRSKRWIALIPTLMLVLAALACDDGPGIETFPVASRGITCITKIDGKLVAPIEVGGFAEDSQNYDLLMSEDGGLTWEREYHREAFRPGGQIYGLPNQLSPTLPSGPIPLCEPSAIAIDPRNNVHLIRFTQGLRIEESLNGGSSWGTIQSLPELQQEIRYYFFHERGSYCMYCDYASLSIGPHDVEFDPETGNLLFAMGWDGVLLRTPEGQWQWIDIYPYALGDISPMDRAPQILFFEYWLAGALGFLILTSLVTYLASKSRLRLLMLCIGWFGWYLILILFTPLSSNGIMLEAPLEPINGAGLALILLIVIALPMILMSAVTLLDHLADRSAYLILLSMLATAAYLIPYYLWIHGVIARYTTAKLVAVIISLALVLSISLLLWLSPKSWAQRLQSWNGAGPIRYRMLGYYMRSDGIIRAAPEQPQIHLQTTNPAQPAMHQPLIHPRRPGR